MVSSPLATGFGVADAGVGAGAAAGFWATGVVDGDPWGFGWGAGWGDTGLGATGTATGL